MVELDGAWVRSHDNAGGMEAKVGVVHAGSERIGRTRTRLAERRYAATFGGVGAFGPLVTAAVGRATATRRRSRRCWGTGRSGSGSWAAPSWPRPTAVLDRWHLADARRRALRRAVPEAEERADVDPADRAVPGHRRRGGGAGGAGGVGRGGATRRRWAEFAAFLTEQAPRIPDYAARRAAGLPIGSGGVEKGVDVVVNRRFKGKRGMKWGRARAEGVLALRVAELNDEWRQCLGPIPHLDAPLLPAF